MKVLRAVIVYFNSYEAMLPDRPVLRNRQWEIVMAKKKRRMGQLWRRGILMLLLLLCIFGLTYSAQLKDLLREPVVSTLTWSHKPSYTVTLSAEEPVRTEQFRNPFLYLQKISIAVRAHHLDGSTKIHMMLTDEGDGTVYYDDTRKVKNALSSARTDDGEKTITWDLTENGIGAFSDVALAKLSANGVAGAAAAIDPADNSAENPVGGIVFTQGTNPDGSPLPANLQGHELIMTVELLDAKDSVLEVTASWKDRLVDYWNKNPSVHYNIIHQVEYANTAFFRSYFLLICALLLLFAALAYFFLRMVRVPVWKCFLPLGLIAGIAFSLLVPVYGVPDEPNHMDTAYRYSNLIMGVGDTGDPDKIWQRQCDSRAKELLGYDVESGSYYQVYVHTFEYAPDTDLIQVAYTDTSTLAPAVCFIPAALGLTLGRVLHLSGLLTLQLARLFNLLAFLLLTQFALAILPFGRNTMALVSFLPVTLQQACSASYDAVLLGCVFLFCAIAFRAGERGVRAAGSSPSGGAMAEERRAARTDGAVQGGRETASATGRNRGGKTGNGRVTTVLSCVLAALLVVVIAVTKSGVYLPLVICLILYARKQRKSAAVSVSVPMSADIQTGREKRDGMAADEQRATDRERYSRYEAADRADQTDGNGGSAGKRRVSAKVVVPVIIAAVVLVVAFALRWLPLLGEVTNMTGPDGEALHYSVGYLLSHPLETIGIYWNTLLTRGGTHLTEMLGDNLGWRTISVSNLLTSILLVLLLLSPNAVGDRPDWNAGPGANGAAGRGFIILGVLLSVFLVATGILVGYTSAGQKSIIGIQGRYFVPLLPAALLAISNAMVRLNPRHVRRLWMVAIITLCTIAVQIPVKVL